MKYVLSIFVCTILCACASFNYRTAEEHAYSFLGKEVKDCGSVNHDQESLNAQNCILDSLQNETNFFSWYWLRPVDSVPAAGILFKDGLLYVAWYDSGGIIRGSHFVPTKCASWEVDLEKLKPITCNLADGEKAYLFGLSAFMELNESPT